MHTYVSRGTLYTSVRCGRCHAHVATAPANQPNTQRRKVYCADCVLIDPDLPDGLATSIAEHEDRNAWWAELRESGFSPNTIGKAWSGTAHSQVYKTTDQRIGSAKQRRAQQP